MTLSRCKRLIKSVLKYPIMSMQCVYISQALLHLIVSLIDTGQRELEDMLLNHEIRGIADSFESNASRLTSLEIDELQIQEITRTFESNFTSCCGDLPGAVAVRHSYEVYLNMVESDLQDLKHEKWKTNTTISWKIKSNPQSSKNTASGAPMRVGLCSLLVCLIPKRVTPRNTLVRSAPDPRQAV